MICSGVVTEVAGERYRIAVGTNISGLLPRLQTVSEEYSPPEIKVGDIVAVVFWGQGLSRGVVLGRYDG